MITQANSPSRKIDGQGRTVRELLAGRKYSVDFYQREYRWQKKQIQELVDDLADTFLKSYEEGDARSAVGKYSHYFLGSIIVSEKDGQKFIIDGQQRLTTLTILLIFLLHRVEASEQETHLTGLIFSERYGARSFNLDIEERRPAMEAIYRGDYLPNEPLSESVANIWARYADIEELFPDELKGPSLPYFVDWLIENVHLVEITAYSDGDAYAIFETMNDRGLTLDPTDMLKGYLLAEISEADRQRAMDVWKKQIQSLKSLGKDEAADGIKAWLRGQHAVSIRDRKRGASPQDFDLIGTEFHRWVRNNADALHLQSSAEFSQIIEREFLFYTRWYERLRRAAVEPILGLEKVFYNAQQNFTLQYAVMLAPLCVEDNEMICFRKVRVVAAYLDVLINRYIWNFKAIGYSTMQYKMFLVMRDIRRQSLEGLVNILSARLEVEEQFGDEEPFQLRGVNGRQVHLFLARVTDYVETSSGQASHYTEYSQRGRKGYEIEHIWANHADRHTEEFSHASEFQSYRNRIGGLLLLPKSFNASYGDLEYADKCPYYLTQNLLACSLNKQAYEHNPGFKRFIQESGLSFQSHERFKRDDLDARQKLYRQLACRIWRPAVLSEEAAS